MFKKIMYPALMIMMAWIFIFPLAVQAEDNRVSYSVEAIIPDNQIDLQQSYFDLKVSPGDKQELGIIIHNNEQEAITVKLSVNNATTNSNGLVVYEHRERFDESLVVPLSDILSFPREEVVIAAGDSQTVVAELEMPKEEFDGIVLGGLHFEKVMEEEESSEGVNIQNKYAYVIGVQLSENDNEVLPKLALTSIRPDLVNHRTTVIAKIQNSERVLIKDLSIHARVYKKGKKEVFKEKQQDGVKMAPNSTMNFLIDWKNERLETGTYRLEMEATHEEEVWTWEEEFEIGKEEAKSLNEEAVEIEESSKLWLWLTIGITVLLIIILVLLLYIRSLKAKEE